MNDLEILTLFAKDKLVKTSGNQVLNWGPTTWALIVEAKVNELINELTATRMQKLRARYNV